MEVVEEEKKLPPPQASGFPFYSKGAFGEKVQIYGGNVKIVEKPGSIFIAINKMHHLPATNDVGYVENIFTTYEAVSTKDKYDLEYCYNEIYAFPKEFEGRDEALALLQKYISAATGLEPVRE